jgi:F-type H+-transporting ATPase subunit b
VDFNLTLIGQTIAMIVFVGFCMKFVWPPIMAVIEARQVEIADGLAAAERGQANLENAKEEADKIISAARDQARGIVDQAHSRASGIVEEARAEGEAARLRQIESARTEVEVEMNRARNELRQQVATIAIAGAEKVLAREIDASRHRELLDQLTSEL